MHDLIASARQDVDELQYDITKLHSYEDNLKSDMTEIQSEVNKNDSEESNEEEQS